MFLKYSLSVQISYSLPHFFDGAISTTYPSKVKHLQKQEGVSEEYIIMKSWHIRLLMFEVVSLHVLQWRKVSQNKLLTKE